MNKRIILNVMIVAMLTFYMIFNIVYNRVLDGPSETDEPVVTDVVWEQPFLVPNPWHLKRIEFPSLYIQRYIEDDAQQQWRSSNQQIDSTVLTNIANSWKNLQATNVMEYQDLPLEGSTILAFVDEDSQPLVFRLIETSEQLQFYRMIDKKVFSFSIASKSQFIPVLN